jgi:galactokinase
MASAPLIARAFRDRFGVDPAVVASAPGRVNLIGEHTDYNEGFVLPMAVEARAYVAIAPRPDGQSRIHSVQLDRTVVLDHREEDQGTGGHRIPYGVLREFSQLGTDDSSAASPACALQLADDVTVDVLIDSDVPLGAGLSSSAAIEMAIARGLCELVGRKWIPLEMAELGQRVEHRYAGVRSGLMDQAVIAIAREGSALLLDCRTFDSRAVPLPPGMAVVVMDTGVRRTLATSEYNLRRDACEEAVAAIRSSHPRVQSLRDVDAMMLDSAAGLLTEVQLRRARHVVTENERVREFVASLEAGDVRKCGKLLDASHASLRDDFDVSGPQLDIVCDLARSHPSCFGARLTGAGFGGCALALVREHDVQEFIAAIQPRYEAATYKRSAFFRALPSAGARIDARTGRPEGRAAG